MLGRSRRWRERKRCRRKFPQERLATCPPKRIPGATPTLTELRTAHLGDRIRASKSLFEGTRSRHRPPLPARAEHNGRVVAPRRPRRSYECQCRGLAAARRTHPERVKKLAKATNRSCAWAWRRSRGTADPPWPDASTPRGSSPHQPYGIRGECGEAPKRARPQSRRPGAGNSETMPRDVAIDSARRRNPSPIGGPARPKLLEAPRLPSRISAHSQAEPRYFATAWRQWLLTGSSISFTHHWCRENLHRLRWENYHSRHAIAKSHGGYAA